MTREETPWRDADTLEKLYHSEGLTVREIADRLGCSRHPVWTWMKKHGIDREDAVEGMKRAQLERPTHYRTTERGYEEWKCVVNGDQRTVHVHRLVAVAEFGFDAVCGMVVHHRNGVRWDNRPQNLELMSNAEHGEHHMEQYSERLQFDEDGNISGWSN